MRSLKTDRRCVLGALAFAAVACASGGSTTTPSTDGGIGVDAPTRDTAEHDVDTSMTRVANAFGAFHFTIDKRSPSDQIDFLMAQGYAGTMIKWPGRNEYVKYATHPAVKDGLFKINAVLFDLDLNVPLDILAIRELARDLATTNTVLWTIVFGDKNPERIASAAAIVADATIDTGVTVVLYPHDETAIENVEESLEVLRLAARENLKTSMHLCHEFKAGHRDRLAAVIAASKGSLVLVSINGTFADAEFVPGWDRGILPLDVGDFDVGQAYLDPLLRAGYAGPILLHTFGIKDAPEQHFTRSMARWRAMISEFANTRR